MLVAGSFDTVDKIPRMKLACLLPDGHLDPQFDAHEIAARGVIDLHILSNGRVLLAVNGTNIPETSLNSELFQLQPDGALDPMFQNGVRTELGHIKKLLPEADGTVLVGGSFRSIGGVPVRYLARLFPDGRVDQNFPGIALKYSGEEASMITSIQRLPDGSLLVGGLFDSIQGVWRTGYARFFTDWTIDLNYGRTGPNQGRLWALVSAAGDGFYALGSFFFVNGASRPALARFVHDGRLDVAFDPLKSLAYSGIAYTSAFEEQPDKKILTVDYFRGAAWARRLARLLPDGNLDPSFQAAPSESEKVNAVKVLADGRILVGGGFRTWNQVAVPALLRLQPNGQRDASFFAQRLQIQGSEPIPPAVLSVASVPRDRVLAGGIGFMVQLNFDGQFDTNFTCRIPDVDRREVIKIVLQPDRKLLVLTRPAYGGAQTYGLFRLLPDGQMDSQFRSWMTGSRLSDIVLQPNGRILVGAQDWTVVVQGQERRNLVRLFSDGSVDLSFNPRITTEEVESVALAADGNVVVGLTLPQAYTEWLPAIHKLRADSPTLSRFTFLANGRVELELCEQPNTQLLLEVSENLVAWQSLGAFTMPEGGVVRVTDQMPAAATSRFYRARPTSQ